MLWIALEGLSMGMAAVSKDYDSALLIKPSPNARGSRLSPLSCTDASRIPSRGADPVFWTS